MRTACFQKLFGAAAGTLRAGSTDPNAQKLKYLNSAEGLFWQGRYPESLVHFSKAVQVTPQSARSICLTRPTLQRTNRSLPIEGCSKPYRLDPVSVDARSELARLQLSRGRYQEADSLCKA
jgi:hypothetical protein